MDCGSTKPVAIESAKMSSNGGHLLAARGLERRVCLTGHVRLLVFSEENSKIAAIFRRVYVARDVFRRRIMACINLYSVGFFSSRCRIC